MDARPKDQSEKKPTDLRSLVMRFRVPLIVAAVFLLLIVALYAPAQSYYVAWRTNGELVAQKAQVDQEHTELQNDYDRLLTTDGIEEEARRRGYVSEGETAVTVEGLPAEDEATSQDSATQDVPWYVAIGDFIFQYQGQ